MQKFKGLQVNDAVKVMTHSIFTHKPEVLYTGTVTEITDNANGKNIKVKNSETGNVIAFFRDDLIKVK
jgi:hypothetical protein